MPLGIPNLDTLLRGGVPVYSLNIIAGAPGTGKTIFTQQMLFNYARAHPQSRVVALVTLSEPLVKVVRYMQHFSFFDSELFGERVHYRDIGTFIRDHTLKDITDHILSIVDEETPELLVIDSFRAIRDMASDSNDFRRFCYDLSVRLASARCTTFLVGEYDQRNIANEVEFAVADGIFFLDMARVEGEVRRLLRIHKIRGRTVPMMPFPFKITEDGTHVLVSSLTTRQQPGSETYEQRMATSGIPGLDDLLRTGLPRGHSIILSGISGTGKTTFALQFLVRGAEQGERGLLFSFEESSERLYQIGEQFGWNVRDLVAQGMLRIIFIAQTAIRTEENLEQIIEMIDSFQPRRMVMDSFSVFLHKIQHPVIQQEKAFQMATMIRQVGAVGLFISDIPANQPDQVSRFGVEETVMDGTIVLSTETIRTKRRRFVEIFKMRASNHAIGRHRMNITAQGIEVLYREQPDISPTEKPPPLQFEPVQKIIQSELSHGLAWLVQGEPGIGKSTLTYQFAIEGLQRGEAVLFIAADTPVYQVRQTMHNFGFVPDPYIEAGKLVILDAFSSGRDSLDLSDPEGFLFHVARYVQCMPRPMRKIFDSLTPQGLDYTASDFVSLIHRKNRTLRMPGVSIFDTLPYNVLETISMHKLLNAFDVILDMYTPDWGEMGYAKGIGYRVIQVRKFPGDVDTRSYPYLIVPGRGLVVQHDFYQQKPYLDRQSRPQQMPGSSAPAEE